MTRRILIGLSVVLAGVLAVLIHRFNTAGDGAALTGRTRADFVRSAADGCIARQKASPDNASVEPSVIDAFCGCYAEALARRVTTADIDQLTGATPAAIQQAMTAKMGESEGVCLAKMDEKGGAQGR